MFHFKTFFKSLRYAGRGVKEVFLEEQSFRILFLASFVAVGLMVYLEARLIEIAFITVLFFGLLVLECLNSAVERLVDVVKPSLHDIVRSIKDIMAGAVFLGALGTLMAVCMIVWPYLFVAR